MSLRQDNGYVTKNEQKIIKKIPIHNFIAYNQDKCINVLK